jgi:hypothetical protein
MHTEDLLSFIAISYFYFRITEISRGLTREQIISHYCHEDDVAL